MTNEKKFRLAVGLIKRLRKAGFEAYLAGGCVRDMLLGRTPEDYDIATSAKPADVQQIFSDHKVIPVGEKFGVQLVVAEGIPFEVATFRGERGYSDGRRPDHVFFADLSTDVKRRDFTVNGMMFDPLNHRVIDLVGGQQDLNRGVIRTIGNPMERFAEDRLRLLRAVRFAAKLGFYIEPQTATAIQRLSAQLVLVAPERVREELTKIISGPRRGIALLVLYNLGLLKAYLPEVHNLAGVEQGKEFHPEGDVLMHTALVLSFLPDQAPEYLFWAALLHDTGKVRAAIKTPQGWKFYKHQVYSAQLADWVCRRLRMSSDWTKRIKALVKDHMRFLQVRNMSQSSFRRLLLLEHIDDLLELYRADVLASHMDLRTYRLCRKHLIEIREELKLKEQLRTLLTGKDLIAMGFSPGPLFGKILAAVEEAFLNGEITSRSEAQAFVLKKFAEYRTGEPSQTNER